MKRIISWLDDNVLFALTGFLLAFIPLYPKLPLFEAIPGYIVRVRLEDFLVAFTLLVWLIQLWRKKVSFGPNPLARPILVYLTVGVLSMISAVFITRTVPLQTLHVGKMVLHFLRRVEYFSLFFVFYSTIKSVRQVKIYLGIMLATIVGVTLYGYGQKYLYWPAFSTMNREFAKGWALYLTQHARVISTFGGHYDLAAYTMEILVILWALFFSLVNRWQRALVFIILAGAFWLLILTASRTSFIAYLVGVTVLFGLYMFTRGIKWAVTRWLAVLFISMFIMLSFGDLSDRFSQFLKLDQRLAGIKALVMQPIREPPTPEEVAFLENNLEAVTSKSDFPLLPRNKLPTRPVDVYEDIDDGFIATESATGAAAIKKIDRTYSETAMVYDLSTGIRLDALWPRAIAGFRRNPLLGSGYSTLNKTQIDELTEAESTDNDYLRALGETGILGFLAFGWILAMILVVIWQSFTSIKDDVVRAYLIALMAVVFALLVNAVYIDVFEASKVAFSFWALTGIALGSLKVVEQRKRDEKPGIPDFTETLSWVKRSSVAILTNDKFYLLLIIFLALVLRLYRLGEPLADWHSWRQADTSAVTRNYTRFGINPFYPRYDDLSSIASGRPNPEGYRFVEFPLYNIFSVITDKVFPGLTVEPAGRLTSILASLGTLIFLYFLTKKYFGVYTGMFAAFFFAVIPYNIFWSRVILPEPTLVMFATGWIYFFDKWVKSPKARWWLLSAVFGIAALLVKVTAVFMIVPMVYLVINKWRLKALTNISLYAQFMVIFLPIIAWRWHVSHYPEGVPAYTWLLNGNGIRFKGAWFWWLFAERISKMILGGWGVSLLVIGLIRQIGKGSKNFLQRVFDKLEDKQHSLWLFHWWLLSMVLYLAVFATGNVQHDYYQIILLPVLCVFLARGADLCWQETRVFHKWLARGLLILVILFMLMFGWYQARDLYNINHPEIVEAGREFQRIIGDRDVMVIAPYGGDTAFLYQTGRRGWPIVEGTIDEMIEKGAHYYISVNYDDLTNEIIETARKVELGQDHIHSYKILKQNENFVIVQLVPDQWLPQ